MFQFNYIYIVKYVILFHITKVIEADIDVPTEIQYLNLPTTFDILNDFLLPPPPELRPTELKFITYKPKNTTQALIAETVEYNDMKKVVFYVHGFKTEALNDGVEMKDALFEGTDDYNCVILVDWRKGTYANNSLVSMVLDYKIAATENVPFVGKFLATFIDKYIKKWTYVHLIGHSLGAQISGIAARTLTKISPNRVIDRISALDPAGPIFEYGFGFKIVGHVFPIITEHTLRKTDAKFIDVIHASTMLGMVKEVGHVDFYMKEKDCWFYDIACLHSKSVYVYMASINKCSQMVCPYGKLTDNNECKLNSQKDLSSLGILANMYEGRGKYVAQFFVKGRHFWQKKISTHNCTAYLNTELIAKDRICRVSPSTNSKCMMKPYQTMCEDEQKMCKVGIEGELGKARVTWV